MPSICSESGRSCTFLMLINAVSCRSHASPINTLLRRARITEMRHVRTQCLPHPPFLSYGLPSVSSDRRRTEQSTWTCESADSTQCPGSVLSGGRWARTVNSTFLRQCSIFYDCSDCRPYTWTHLSTPNNLSSGDCVLHATTGRSKDTTWKAQVRLRPLPFAASA